MLLPKVANIIKVDPSFSQSPNTVFTGKLNISLRKNPLERLFTDAEGMRITESLSPTSLFLRNTELFARLAFQAIKYRLHEAFFTTLAISIYPLIDKYYVLLLYFI